MEVYLNKILVWLITQLEASPLQTKFHVFVLQVPCQYRWTVKTTSVGDVTSVEENNKCMGCYKCRHMIMREKVDWKWMKAFSYLITIHKIINKSKSHTLIFTSSFTYMLELLGMLIMDHVRQLNVDDKLSLELIQNKVPCWCVIVVCCCWLMKVDYAKLNVEILKLILWF